MVFERRLALLRLSAMAALIASAVLTGDSLHPGRAFCPLEAACDLARHSALGSFFGIPTALIGMVAFGGLFLLTLLPVEWSRPLLQPAGLVAVLAGVGFVAYQAFILHTFCPLCLVADGAGILAGVITLTWPQVYVRLSGRRLPGEPLKAKFGWTIAMGLAVVLPLALPRPQEPAWVAITPLTEQDFDLMADAEPPAEPVEESPVAEPVPSTAAPPPSPVIVALPPAKWSQMPFPTPTEDTAPTPAQPVSAAPPQERPTPSPTASPAPVPTKAIPPKTVRPRHPTPKPAVSQGPLVVEYLNAYCAHCRATHRRLDRVIAKMGTNVQRRRVYTWGGRSYPLWARACAYAESIGLEEQLFEELMEARGQRASEVYAAARRAGIDVQGLQIALRDPNPPARLALHRKLMLSADLKGLPTLDIGRRRLMGEQSEAELRDALQAAMRAAPR